jgi:hypothetical protein
MKVTWNEWLMKVIDLRFQQRQAEQPIVSLVGGYHRHNFDVCAQLLSLDFPTRLDWIDRDNESFCLLSAYTRSLIHHIVQC